MKNLKTILSAASYGATFTLPALALDAPGWAIYGIWLLVSVFFFAWEESKRSNAPMIAAEPVPDDLSNPASSSSPVAALDERTVVSHIAATLIGSKMLDPGYQHQVVVAANASNNAAVSWVSTMFEPSEEAATIELTERQKREVCADTLSQVSVEHRFGRQGLIRLAWAIWDEIRETSKLEPWQRRSWDAGLTAYIEKRDVRHRNERERQSQSSH